MTDPPWVDLFFDVALPGDFTGGAYPLNEVAKRS